MERDLADKSDFGSGVIQQLHFHSSLEEEFSMFLTRENYSCNKRTVARQENDVGFNQDPDDVDERTEYWESQVALLQEIIERSTLVGLKMREEVVKIIEGAKRRKDLCNCEKPKSDGCANCLRRRVVRVLRETGFNATLCTSKWKSTANFPGGMHEYLELIVSTAGQKKKTPFLIEILFREEFEMPKACQEYHQLVKLLPEIYIGKLEYLKAMLQVVCDAAKRSAKEKKIHMGPWRKRSFMQMKWSGTPSEEREQITDDYKCQNLVLSRPDLHPTPTVPGIRSSPSTAVVVS